MPSKFNGFDGKLAAFNERYKVNFSFEKHEAQSLETEDLAPSLQDKEDDLTRENLAYRNSLLSIYRDCVENMIDKKYESFDPGALIQDFEALMGDYRSYRTSKGKAAPDTLGGCETDRVILDDMKSSINTMVSPNLVKHTEKKYMSGELSIKTIRTFLNQFENRNSENDITLDEGKKINLYAYALENIVNARTFRTRINPLNWLRIRRENKALKLADALVNKFPSHAVPSADDFVLPEKNVAGRAVDNAKSASYARELEAKKAKRKEQQEQNQQIKEDNHDRASMKDELSFLSENNKHEDIVPQIKEDNVLNKENFKGIN